MSGITVSLEVTSLMNFKKILVFSVLTLLISAFTTGSTSGSDKNINIYKIGAKDLITISVFDVPELNITVRVAEDGTITLPLLGNIKLEGLTRAEIEKHLASLLEQKYLKNAQVTVFIKEYQSKMVSIIGAIVKPGNYELLGEKTILELLSIAGGLTGDASNSIIIIRKLKSGDSISLKIKLDDLMLKGDPKLNIPLKAGDIVNIPVERFMNIYIFGEVNKPGHLKMIKDENNTLLRAIAQAAGFTDRARKGSILIKRKVDGKERKIKINAKKILKGKITDFILMDNDIIHVPESIL